ncbi:DUF4214 domain-containing protein [Teichococcus vastitatis]|uniref:DUF4214 domain-containing protein n=1 Tax=Teichococcus vastitatis TaxID=2307076 RepID=A0ABS9W876_9PROT|nr:DUF4214 domain-containing protein [Pseudoroseomonas vastitatis]
MFSNSGGIVRVTLPAQPEGRGGQALEVLEGTTATMRFNRTDTSQDMVISFVPNDPGIASQYFGYDPAKPPTVVWTAGDTSPKSLTIGAVEDALPGTPNWINWTLEPIAGISGFDGIEPIRNGAINNILPVAFLNNDASAEGDSITGTVGADTLAGLGGDDWLDGNYGFDTAVFSGPHREYAVVERPGTGYRQVRDTVAGRDGEDFLSSIERARFADGTLALDRDGNADQAYRLYQAAFARDPDVAGLAHQVRAMDAGLSLLTISANFLNSPEFASRYGTEPSDASLVTLLYRNVLAREPEAAGFSAHIGGLAAGMSREQLLVNFSESAENRLQTAAEIDGGIWLG